MTSKEVTVRFLRKKGPDVFYLLERKGKGGGGSSAFSGRRELTLSEKAGTQPDYVRKGLLTREGKDGATPSDGGGKRDSLPTMALPDEGVLSSRK